MYYRVYITSKTPASNGRRRESASDLSMEDLDARYLDPYRKGQPIVINGRIITGDDVEQVRIFESERPVGHPRNIPDGTLRNVTSDFITAPPGRSADPNVPPDQEFRPASNAREVFVAHGRNQNAKDAIFQFLRAIDLLPLEWSVAVQSTGLPSPYIGEILNAAFSRARAVLILFTPDDEARLKEEFRQAGDPVHETELTGQARQNVLFEAGMAMGLSENRTVLVEVGLLRPLTNLAGRYVIRLNNSTERRQELAQRLRAAGCPVNTYGTDWHNVGDFDAAVQGRGSPQTLNSQPLIPNSMTVTSQGSQKMQRNFWLRPRKDVGWDRGVITKNLNHGRNIYTNTRQKLGGTSGPSVYREMGKEAIRELIVPGYVEDPDGKDSYFQVTHLGFQLVEAIEADISGTGELNGKTRD